MTRKRAPPRVRRASSRSMIDEEWLARLLIEPLDRHKYDRAAFSCGHDRIDNFLKTLATQQADKDVAKPSWRSSRQGPWSSPTTRSAATPLTFRPSRKRIRGASSNDRSEPSIFDHWGQQHGFATRTRPIPPRRCLRELKVADMRRCLDRARRDQRGCRKALSLPRF